MAESYVTSLILLDENKILADLNSIAIELGLINKVFETSRIYIYYAVFARVLGNLTQTVAQYINNMDIETTTDEALLEQMIKPFIRKKDATVAKVILEFSRRDGTFSSPSNIFIPRNFEVMTEGNDPIIFKTAESRIFWKDSQKVLIPAYSVEFGSLNNLMANTLTYFNDANFSDIKVTNPAPAYGGSDEETAFDTRSRLNLFRFGRDNNREFLQELIYNNGISYYGYNLVEYWDGPGTALVVLDASSDEQYYDIVQNIEFSNKGGIKYYYCQAEYIYADLDVTVKITGDNLYTEYQVNEIEENIFTATRLYFDNQIYIGKKLSKNRLEAFILQYLVDEKYDIYEIELNVRYNSDIQIDPLTRQYIVKEFQRIYPNKVTTTVEYNAE